MPTVTGTRAYAGACARAREQVRLGTSVADLADLRAVEPARRSSLDWPADVRLSLDARPSPTPGLAAAAQSDARLSEGGEGGCEGTPAPRNARRGSDGAPVFSADVLVDATGARCGLFSTIGFEQVTALKSARALGVVCHFVNAKTALENALPEANWAQQYHTARFARLKDSGIVLQNIVYYRSTGAFSEVPSFPPPSFPPPSFPPPSFPRPSFPPPCAGGHPLLRDDRRRGLAADKGGAALDCLPREPVRVEQRRPRGPRRLHPSRCR